MNWFKEKSVIVKVLLVSATAFVVFIVLPIFLLVGTAVVFVVYDEVTVTDEEREVRKVEAEEKSIIKEQKEKEEKAKAEKDKKAKEEKKKPEREIKEAMSNFTRLELLSIKGDFEEPFIIQVKFSEKNLTQNMTVSSMKAGLINAVYVIKESGYEAENLGISVKYPLVDKYGNEGNEYVIKSNFGKETISKLSDEKFMIDKEKLDVIAGSSWEHPAIRN